MYKLQEEGRKHACKSAGVSLRQPAKSQKSAHDGSSQPRTRSGGVQPNTMHTNTRMQSRRQSEPVVMMGIDVEDIRKMMDKITGVKEGPYKKTDRDREVSPEPREAEEESDRQLDTPSSFAQMNGLEEKRPDSRYYLMPIHPYEVMMRRGSVEGYRIPTPQENRAKTSKPRSFKEADKNLVVEERRVRSSVQKSPREATNIVVGDRRVRSSVQKSPREATNIVVGDRRVRSSVQKSPREATVKYHVDRRAKTSKSRLPGFNDLKVEGGKFGQVVAKKRKDQRPKSFKRSESAHASSSEGHIEVPQVFPTFEFTGVDMVGADGSHVQSSTDEEIQEIWDDVRRCRYIRGYDPPEMRLPSGDASEFVFGRSYSDAHTFIKTGKLP